MVKCPNCTLSEFVPPPHERYILVPFDEATGKHTQEDSFNWRYVQKMWTCEIVFSIQTQHLVF